MGALLWQMMRYYILHFLKSLSSDGKEITEQDIIDWCNAKMADAGEELQMHSFKDSHLSNAVYMLRLLHRLRPESVEESDILPGETEDEKAQNAKYAITCARKMRCSIFLLWEDIVEVKPKMIMTFFGAIMSRFAKTEKKKAGQ